MASARCGLRSATVRSIAKAAATSSSESNSVRISFQVCSGSASHRSSSSLSATRSSTADPSVEQARARPVAERLAPVHVAVFDHE